ncbi:MAG TPA: YciK family oxidoreductase [Steroidobacteraceae bacterium]|jgi:NAD(P)-dependent dehydrogenase (short-subunit alcohol dehydrogenase family)|nr:YciK family oxidoreductase [Steroidobacteraceae bacterium]
MSENFDPRSAPVAQDELRERVILITGASSGIGRAVAVSCAQHGATVLLLGRNGRQLSEVHAQITAECGTERAAIVEFDLENALARDYDALFTVIEQRYQRLDGLLHNAGMLGQLTPIEHYDVPTWCRVLQVNLTAAFVLTQILLPLLKRSADGSIVFTASQVGRVGRAYWGAYAVSKFALEGLNEVLSQELAGTTAIRVNSLNPGATRTKLRRQAYPAEDVSLLATPQSITRPYIALLGPTSRGVSGGRFNAQ